VRKLDLGSHSSRNNNTQKSVNRSCRFSDRLHYSEIKFRIRANNQQCFVVSDTNRQREREREGYQENIAGEIAWREGYQENMAGEWDADSAKKQRTRTAIGRGLTMLAAGSGRWVRCWECEETQTEYGNRQISRTAPSTSSMRGLLLLVVVLTLVELGFRVGDEEKNSYCYLNERWKSEKDNGKGKAQRQSARHLIPCPHSATPQLIFPKKFDFQ